MHSAIVLINCDLGYEEEIIKTISNISGVTSIVGTYGVYDLVANVKTQTLEELNNSIARIRKIPHVKATITLIVIEGQGVINEEYR